MCKFKGKCLGTKGKKSDIFDDKCWKQFWLLEINSVTPFIIQKSGARTQKMLIYYQHYLLDDF